MIAVLRETRSNRYTLNALTGILDGSAAEWTVVRGARETAEIARAIWTRGRRVLVLYSFMTPDLGWVKPEIRALAREVPGAVRVAGGPHATADPEGTVALGFHYAFVGSVETTLPAFLAAGGTAESVVRTVDGDAPSWDACPPFGRGRIGPVELTRGCRWACAFCSVGRNRVRHRSRDSVLEAAERLRRSGRRRIFFITPDALCYGDGLGALDALLGDLRSMGCVPVLGTFPSEVRPDRVTRDALEVLARHCQNRTLVIGAQSGNDAVLRRLRRGHTVDQVVRAAHLAREFRFSPHVDLIFGLPQETVEERRATIDLARRLRKETGAKIHAHYFHPLPGTSLWGEDPTPLDEETRSVLLHLRRGGAEDGFWEEQERWAWKILEWAERGWIQTPRRPNAAR